MNQTKILRNHDPWHHTFLPESLVPTKEAAASTEAKAVPVAKTVPEPAASSKGSYLRGSPPDAYQRYCSHLGTDDERPFCLNTCEEGQDLVEIGIPPFAFSSHANARGLTVGLPLFSTALMTEHWKRRLISWPV